MCSVVCSALLQYQNSLCLWPFFALAVLLFFFCYDIYG
jgi:hypothetical protein